MKNILTLILLLAFAHGASAQSFKISNSDKGSLYDEINRLKKENKLLNDKLYGSDSDEKKTVNVVAKLQAKIDQLQQDIRSLNGKVQEAEYKSSKVSDKMDLFMKDIEFRFKQLDEKYSSEEGEDDLPSSLDEEASSLVEDDIITKEISLVNNVGNKKGDNNKITLQGLESSNDTKDEEVVKKIDYINRYNQSVSYIKKGEYLKAEEILKDFVSNNKDSDLISNAYYWLGETYYVRGDYNNSAVNFLMGYQKNSKGNKAPDNLLKLGMSLQSLKKKDEACTTFSKLLVEYPKVSKSLKEKVSIRLSDLACQ